MSGKEKIVSDLNAMAERYNAAIDARKVRAIRAIVVEAHAALCAAIRELDEMNEADAEVALANVMLMDVRWGRRTRQFVDC